MAIGGAKNRTDWNRALTLGVSISAFLLSSMAGASDRDCAHVAACQGHCHLPEVSIADLEAKCSVSSILEKKRKNANFNADSFLGSEGRFLDAATRESIPDVDTLCSASRKLGDSTCDSLFKGTHQNGDVCVNALYTMSSHLNLDSISKGTDPANAITFLKGSNQFKLGQVDSFKSQDQLASEVQRQASSTKQSCNWFYNTVHGNRWNETVPKKLNTAPAVMTRKMPDGSIDEAGVLLADNKLKKACGDAGGILGLFGMLDPVQSRRNSDNARQNMLTMLGSTGAEAQRYIMQAPVEDLYCLNNEYIAELQLQKERLEVSDSKLNSIKLRLSMEYNLSYDVLDNSTSGIVNLSGLPGSGSIVSTGLNQNQRLTGVPEVQLNSSGDTAGSGLSTARVDTAPSLAGVPVGENTNGVAGAFNGVANAATSNPVATIGIVGLGTAGVIAATSGGSSGANGAQAIKQNSNQSQASLSEINAFPSGSASTNSNTNTVASSPAQTQLAGSSGGNPNNLTNAAAPVDGSSVSGKNTSGASSASSSLKDAVRDRLSNGGGAGSAGGSSGAFGGTLGQLSSASDGRDSKAGAKGSGFSSVGTLDGSGAEVKTPVAVAGSETDASIKDIMQNMQAMMGGVAEPMENLSNTGASGEARAPASSKSGSYSFDREVAAADTAPLFERVHESINRCLNKGCIINGLGNKL